jgi:uncharacterized protein
VEPVTFTTSDGVTLSGAVARPVRAPRARAVICHPHPLHGGSMDAWLVPLMQDALTAAGCITLRFDFRGVGRSEGRFSDGPGELRDVDAAVSWLAGDAPDLPLVVAGWSFGAGVALRWTTDHVEQVAGWVGVGLVPSLTTGDALRVDAEVLRTLEVPLTFVHGSNDTVAPLYRVRALAELAHHGTLVLCQGGDHQLSRHGPDVSSALVDAVDRITVAT